MVVTLLVVFHGLKNDRKNKETKQCWKNDGINHGSSMKGCLWSSSAAAQPVCQSRDRYMGRCWSEFSAGRP